MNFSDSEKEEIKDAVITAEQKTTGEIVPVIIKVSDDYSASYFRSALLIGFVALYLCYFFQFEGLHFLFAYIMGVLLGLGLCYFDKYRKLFITKDELDEEFTQRAYQAFLLNGITQTKERNAIMIFLSAFERKAMIVSDIGIQEKIDNKLWEGVINELVKSLAKKEYTKGIVEAVEKCGELLSEKFPGTKENTNELANKLIIEV